MKLCNIKLTNFRNIEYIELSPYENINVIYGKNAQGKTNIIEAIWLFTGNQSFRGSKMSELIKHESDFARLDISFADKRRDQTASIVLSGKRKIVLNGVEIKTLSKLNGNFYSVVFSPSHLSLIKEGPKNRRDFLDIAISQIKPKYENYISSYENLLEQRNSLLKNSYKYSDLKSNLEIWDIQLAKIGTAISLYRQDYVKELSALAYDFYDGISSQNEKLNISYESTIFEEDVLVYSDENIETYRNALLKSLDNDINQGFTTVGIHRDDISVLIDGLSSKSYGSQGQQRSAVISIKLAEAELLERVTGEKPIMLLDDIMSELDISRQNFILNKLKNTQVFITCCDILNTELLETGHIYSLEKGKLTQTTQKTKEK